MTDIEIRKQVGNNLRFLRTRTFKEVKNKKNETVMRYLRQGELANDVLNVTFQQIQKYEKGTNGLSGEKLYKLSKFFEVPMEMFFDKRLIERQTFSKLIKENVQQNNL